MTFTQAASISTIVLCLLQASQDALAAPAAMTWEQAVQETSQNNPDLKSSRAALQAAQDQISGARSGYFPQLTANLSSTYGTSSSIGTTQSTTSTNTLVNGPARGKADTSFSASITATENLFNGFQTTASVNQAQANERISKAALQTARARVSYDLKSAYMGLYYAQSSVKLSDDIIRRREENLRIVELRYENGSENKGSVLLSKAYLKQAQYDASQAKNAYKTSQRQLLQVLGRDESDEGASFLQVAGPVPGSEPEKQVNLQEIALQTPDHLQAVAQEAVSEAAVTTSQSGFFPAVGLVGNFGRNGDTFFPNSTQNWSFGVNLSYPFFTGGKDYYASRAAKENRVAASYNRESVDRGLLAKLEQAFNGFNDAVEKLKVDQSFLEASTVREKIGRSKYNNGLLTFEDWDIIENDLISRQKTVLQSERDRIVAEAAWEQAQGKGVIQ